MQIVPIAFLLVLSATPTADGPIKTPEQYEAGQLPSITKVPVADKYLAPKLELIGADTAYSIGDLICISVKPLDNIPDDLKASIYSWTVLPPPKDLVTWPQNEKILFGTGPVDTKYTVILHATFTYADGPKIEQRTSTIVTQCTVGRKTEPPKAAERNDLTGSIKMQQFINKISESINTVQKAGYSDDNRKSDVKRLAASFRKLAGVLESQSGLTAETIMTMQASDNASALGNNTDAWMAWFENLAKNIKEYEGVKEFEPKRYAEIYRLIASALESY